MYSTYLVRYHPHDDHTNHLNTDDNHNRTDPYLHSDVKVFYHSARIIIVCEIQHINYQNKSKNKMKLKVEYYEEHVQIKPSAPGGAV